jgi:hypothetical protein
MDPLRSAPPPTNAALCLARTQSPRVCFFLCSHFFPSLSFSLRASVLGARPAFGERAEVRVCAAVSATVYHH